MLGQEARSRYRAYRGFRRHLRLGMFKECGLPKEVLPTIIGGKVDVDVNAWLEERRAAGK